MNPHEEQRLRELLDRAVADVEPRPGLDEIRSRTKVHSMSNRPWLFAAGGAVLATAATIAAFTVLDGEVGATSSEPRFASGGPTRAAVPSAPAADPSATQTSPSSEPTSGSTTIPVYYVGQTGQGPRLYREFHKLPAVPTDTALAEAVHQALTMAPADPDYTTPWPSGAGVAHAELAGDTIVVDLKGSGLAQRPSGLTKEDSFIAVQQLVYTATAAVQKETGVRFLLDGQPTDSLLGVPTEQPVTRAQSSATLAQVWIIDPPEGATVPSGFTVNGIGAFFEANVTWELRQGDTVVKSGFTTAEECCTMAPYSFTVEAPPGDYTLVVRDEDASGGEGPAPFEDSKDITIR
jgi:hypothetical protein